LSFKVHGLDCAEEVALIRRALSPLLNESALSFDLMNARLNIAAPPHNVTHDTVRGALATAGMRAIPWEEHLAAQAVPQSFWREKHRELLCGASGAAAVLAFVLHGAISGFAAALFAGETGGATPIPAELLYSVAILAGLWPLMAKARYALFSLRPDINLLVVVAVLGAIALGNWFEAALVAVLFNFSLLLESWSVGRARRAVTALMELSPKKARYICPHDGDIMERPVAEVAVGVVALVRPGERVPLDGEIVKGESSINQAPITGESMPVSKGIGDRVYAGSINQEGALEFRVTRAAEDSSIARIIRMVEEARERRAPSEQWVEKFARVYTPVMMLLALLTATVPPLLFGAAPGDSIYNALVLLLIACPCALVISTPVTIVAGLAAAARRGILIKGGNFLELPARVRAFAFDKTGTLTLGVPEVREVLPISAHTAQELLATAATVEAESTHPLALAIRMHAAQAEIAAHPTLGHTLIPGRGADARTAAGACFWVGNERLLRERAENAAEAQRLCEQLGDASHTLVFVGVDRRCIGLLSLADTPRPEAKGLIRGLHAAGVRETILLTGDNQATARGIAEAVGIDAWQADLMPDEKLAAIDALEREQGPVAMVGDGVNDAPAMARASLGIAMGAIGTDAALETADIALMSDDLGLLPWLVLHSRRTVRIIQQNVALAIVIKVSVLGLALTGWGTLWLAIAADMGASLLVIFNGLRLLRAKA